MVVLDAKTIKLIKSLPPQRLNDWVESIYKSGFKDGIEKIENDIYSDAEVMSIEKVLEKLTKAGFSLDDANYILEVLLNE